MIERTLTCIKCPLGCQLSVTVDDAGAVTVTGNTCPRGAAYGEEEVIRPMRTVTGSVRVSGGELPLCSVKTAGDIPKDRIFEVMKEIRSVRLTAPVEIGQTVIEDAAGTGVAVVATRSVR